MANLEEEGRWNSSCLLWGPLIIGLRLGFFENMGKEFFNASSNVLFNIFNKMNSDLAYFDVSHNIEILHINDSNEFENEINKQLEKKEKIFKNSSWNSKKCLLWN